MPTLTPAETHQEYERLGLAWVMAVQAANGARAYRNAVEIFSSPEALAAGERVLNELEDAASKAYRACLAHLKSR